MPSLFIEVPTDDGSIRVPAVYAVCDCCEGRGSVDNLGVIDTSDPDWDEERLANYFAGGYDVRCPECKGKRVVLVADEDNASADALAAYRQHLDGEAEYAAACRAERRALGYY